MSKNISNIASILATIEDFATDVESKFTGLLDSLSDLKDDIQQIGQLKKLVNAAENMLEGDVSHPIDSDEVKGEVGRLVSAINETLKKLQQLDQSVQKESDRVPELAAHLDLITQETETATQQVLEKLDAMLEASDAQNENLEALKKISDQRLQTDREFVEKINSFFQELENSTDRDQMVQEAVDFIALMASDSAQNLKNTEEINKTIGDITEQGTILQDHSFDIMNLLQFQDITRQKISKVIGLLKDLQGGLKNLLSIFNLDHESMEEIEINDYHKATQDKILDRQTNVDGKEAIDVDAIIASFQNKD